jgi:hypothetical protein
MPKLEDLTQVPDSARTQTIDVTITEEARRALQAEADRRGVTLEAYARWLALTAAASVEAGGDSGPGGEA